MDAMTIISLLGAAGAVLLWALYLAEGLRQSLWQGVLLCVPFYVFYFAYIRSTKQVAYRWVLLVCTVAALAASTAHAYFGLTAA